MATAQQKIKSTLNQWATLETPPSKFERFVPEKLKGQWGIFPFAYLRIGEPVNSNFLKALGAEFLGTMMFMFILVSQVIFSCYIGEGTEANKVGASTCLMNPVRILPIAAAAGFTMFVLIYATASFSGGHLNPAVIVGALVANKISCMRAVAYVFMQIAGAIVGTAFVWTIDSVGPAANVLSSTGRVGHAGAFMVEFLLTFALMWVSFFFPLLKVFFLRGRVFPFLFCAKNQARAQLPISSLYRTSTSKKLFVKPLKKTKK